MNQIPTEPGLYRDVDFQTYLDIRLPNSGAIRWGMVSMQHMKAAVDGRIADSDSTAKRFGRAEHCMVLEPEQFESRFLIAKPCQAVLKSGNRKGELCGKSSSLMASDSWFCGTHAPPDATTPQGYVTEDELARLQRIRDTLHNHELLTRVRKPGWSEVTLIFDWLGVRWKGRVDRMPEDGSILFDLKKCQVGHATRDAMERAVHEYGYHRQATLYSAGVAILTGKQPDFAWVFAEDNEPFGVNILHIDHATMSVAETEIEAVAKKWRKAVETGVYPGYLSSAADVQRGGLPEWYIKRNQEAA